MLSACSLLLFVVNISLDTGSMYAMQAKRMLCELILISSFHILCIFLALHSHNGNQCYLCTIPTYIYFFQNNASKFKSFLLSSVDGVGEPTNANEVDKNASCRDDDGGAANLALLWLATTKTNGIVLD